MGELLISGADVVQCSGDGCTVLRRHDILIRGRHITEVAPSGQVGEGFTGELIEGRGSLAMPGLINTHAHTPMCIFRGLAEDVDLATWFNDFMWPLERNLTEEDVFWGMQLGLAEMIRAGVTAVCAGAWSAGITNDARPARPPAMPALSRSASIPWS